jgi:muramoyltetrapeptide carboxypeptidase LdcA involved in peptidoglycan recycling
MKYKKPQRLNKGDSVAIVSPSWAGPSVFPKVYENGLKILKEWGLNIKEYPTARADNDFLSKNPQARAKDINDAFADPEVKAIFASIGGDDSVRILPFLDKNIIANNPKILMGYSDTTTLLVFGNLQGLVTFHGPAIMAGFSQMENLPGSFKTHVHEMLFNPKEAFEYLPYGQYCDGYLDWSKDENLDKTNELKADKNWRVVQGSGIVEGELFGGCIEVLEFMKGTDFWPSKDFWDGKILFLETSEEKPTINNVRWMLRNYGIQGVFDKVSAILLARPRDYSDDEKTRLDEMIKDVIGEEFGKENLPIMTNLDFGHTDPQFVLPLGIKAQVDLNAKTFKLVESWLS